jgi:hypothetical protein
MGKTEGETLKTTEKRKFWGDFEPKVKWWCRDDRANSAKDDFHPNEIDFREIS